MQNWKCPTTFEPVPDVFGPVDTNVKTWAQLQKLLEEVTNHSEKFATFVDVRVEGLSINILVSNNVRLSPDLQRHCRSHSNLLGNN